MRELRQSRIVSTQRTEAAEREAASSYNNDVLNAIFSQQFRDTTPQPSRYRSAAQTSSAVQSTAKKSQTSLIATGQFNTPGRKSPEKTANQVIEEAHRQQFTSPHVLRNAVASLLTASPGAKVPTPINKLISKLSPVKKRHGAAAAEDEQQQSGVYSASFLKSFNDWREKKRRINTDISELLGGDEADYKIRIRAEIRTNPLLQNLNVGRSDKIQKEQREHFVEAKKRTALKKRAARWALQEEEGTKRAKKI